MKVKKEENVETGRINILNFNPSRLIDPSQQVQCVIYVDKHTQKMLSNGAEHCLKNTKEGYSTMSAK